MSVLDDLRKDGSGDRLAALSYNAVLHDVREALLAQLDELRQDDEDGHPATAAYNEALDDVRRWAGGDDS